MNSPVFLQKIYRVFRFQGRRLEFYISRKVSLDWFDIARYQKLIGERPDLRNPKTWNEKLLWLNRHWQPDIKAELSDKWKVREYISKKGLDFLLIPLLGVWDSPNEIDFDSLPEQFVLKCNHGSACNIICKNRSQLNIDEAKKKLSHWLSIDYGKLYNEKHYSKIKPRIVGENFLPSLANDTSVVDYKIHCFNGEPNFILVCTNRDNHKVSLSSYSLKWERIDCLVNEKDNLNVSIPKPSSLDRMVEYSRILSKSFPYVRVDFYEINNEPLFGELTFTPAANIMAYYSEAVQIEKGSLLKLVQ